MRRAIYPSLRWQTFVDAPLLTHLLVPQTGVAAFTMPLFIALAG